MPLAQQQQLSEDTQLALWKLEESAEVLLQLLPPTLQEEGLRTPIANHLLFRQRLASRVALAQLLPGEQVVLGRQGHKRTVLLQPARHLSLSHAGDYAAVI